jgi:hypothetical protein
MQVLYAQRNEARDELKMTKAGAVASEEAYLAACKTNHGLEARVRKLEAAALRVVETWDGGKWDTSEVPVCVEEAVMVLAMVMKFP